MTDKMYEKIGTNTQDTSMRQIQYTSSIEKSTKINTILHWRYMAQNTYCSSDNERATQAEANRVTDAAQEQGKSFLFNFKNIILNIL